MGITVNRINVTGNVYVGVPTPSVDPMTIYDWTFTETTGPYPNKGAGGSAGDFTTVDAGVVRGVSSP